MRSIVQIKKDNIELAIGVNALPKGYGIIFINQLLSELFLAHWDYNLTVRKRKTTTKLVVVFYVWRRGESNPCPKITTTQASTGVVTDLMSP